MPNLKALKLIPFSKNSKIVNIPSSIIYYKSFHIELDINFPNLKYVFLTGRPQDSDLVLFLAHIPNTIFLYVNSFNACRGWNGGYKFHAGWAEKIPPKVKYLGICMPLMSENRRPPKLPPALQYWYVGSPVAWTTETWMEFRKSLPNLRECGEKANKMMLNVLKRWKKTNL